MLKSCEDPKDSFTDIRQNFDLKARVGSSRIHVDVERIFKKLSQRVAKVFERGLFRAVHRSVPGPDACGLRNRSTSTAVADGHTFTCRVRHNMLNTAGPR